MVLGKVIALSVARMPLSRVLCKDYETTSLYVFYFTWTILNCNDIKPGTSRRVVLGFGKWIVNEVSGVQFPTPFTNI